MTTPNLTAAIEAADRAISTPEDAIEFLTALGERFAQSGLTLAQAHQDGGLGGRVWHDLARSLDKAAIRARRFCQDRRTV